jgi:pyruvyl transferase EpsO
VTADGVLHELRRAIQNVVDPLLPQNVRCALLDFPNHPNVGDSAIWLGQRAYLDGRGIRPVYESDQRTYSSSRLARRVGDGTLLLTGGGNFGDLWPSFQAFRERVIADFPNNRIILLPQTIHFTNAGALERARRVLNAHPDLTILVRDRSSLSLAREHFTATVALCPDMALAASDIPAPADRGRGILWLARRDAESAGYAYGGEVDDVTYADWAATTNTGGDRAPFLVTRKFPGLEARLGGVATVARRMLGRSLDDRAAERVDRGRAMIERAGVVITDRLHGHILCLLMGVPHVLLDDLNGKVKNFYDTWTNESSITRWADSPEEALATARSLGDSA